MTLDTSPPAIVMPTPPDSIRERLREVNTRASAIQREIEQRLSRLPTLKPQ